MKRRTTTSANLNASLLPRVSIIHIHMCMRNHNSHVTTTTQPTPI